ncbi:MAG: 4Fe-4S binding protein [Thermoplasmatota archaeon]
MISEDCVGCGLCVLRCPFGAVFLDQESGMAKTKTGQRIRLATSHEFSNYYASITLKKDFSSRDRDVFVRHVKNGLSGTDKSIFYPFVASLITSIGLPCAATRIGDTNDRTDAKIAGPFGIVPIEIKSPTEVERIDIKSVEQALENKIVCSSRCSSKTPTKKNVTSLIVGFERPNLRSDVYELIDNIHDTFGINIGVLSISDLLHILWNRFIGSEMRFEPLLKLKGAYVQADKGD